jgi:hypothetical protein
MRFRSSWRFLFLVAFFAGLPSANADFVTYSHSSSELPGAPGPAITLLSLTGNNDGTNLTFTLTFSNPTIEGPSSNNPDAVYGFINIDTDKNSATGVSGTFLDSNGFQPGFGRYSPSSAGIDLYINLSSEGSITHPGPGLVDLVPTDTLTPIATEPISYKNQAGSTPSTLSVSIPLSFFSTNHITLVDTGNFSAIVGNLNNATDFLPPPAVIPEPSSLLLLGTSMLSLGGLAAWRMRRRVA